MANAWMPAAGRVTSSFPAGRPGGGAPRAVWCVSESDPEQWSAHSAARRLDSEGRAAHLVWHPVTGDVVQLLPATAAAVGQLTPHGTIDRASEGRVCIVIQVIGRSPEPFTDGPLNGLDAILAWLDSWGIPRTWPAGAPGARARRSSAAQEYPWSLGGHFGHSQVPGSAADGPGAIDPVRLHGHWFPRPRREQPGTAPDRRRPVASGMRSPFSSP
ncbi:hypothetical protein [Thermobifida cellulosilytica]|uniref:N-acetylmuramoyl-L-alanine amidase domain-containing protein n=1 Tax=Thermobifida cellulosilytica TB100 TaxID=665004 RepID=A0A147KDE6_THECS|nr:hypothetical protein [Thermobifida cellulosilytica]KUP95303.1 hypothetical protein AC529_18385 [Thermobifida cellulosilytica TB100]